MQLLAAQVEEAVLEPHVFAFVSLFVRNVYGRHLRGGLHRKLVGLDLDFARRQLRVDGVRSPQLDFACHGDHAFEVGLLNQAEEASRGVYYYLREAVVVAKVHEEDAAMVTEAEHPA